MAGPTKIADAKTQKQYDLLRDTLVAQGSTAAEAGAMMRDVGEIKPAETHPRRTDLMIKVGSRRYRSVAGAAKALVKAGGSRLDAEEPEETEEPPESSEGSDDPAPITASATATPDDGEEGPSDDSKDVHLHFHIRLPKDLLRP